ncbi:hypothetical protein Droror1_Dr00026218, partial [Drosera rotundifolia]
MQSARCWLSWSRVWILRLWAAIRSGAPRRQESWTKMCEGDDEGGGGGRYPLWTTTSLISRRYACDIGTWLFGVK